MNSGGLSPPTRGSQMVLNGMATPARSIPAHAGKPGTPITSSMRLRVYPRPRGEARRSTASPLAVAGLSPPTRGSRTRPETPHRVGGSIPAHAGKPLMLRCSLRVWGVYPRPRGEACH